MTVQSLSSRSLSSEALSPDVVAQVFSFVTPFEHLRLKAVSRSWSKTGNSPAVIKSQQSKCASLIKRIDAQQKALKYFSNKTYYNDSRLLRKMLQKMFKDNGNLNIKRHLQYLIGRQHLISMDVPLSAQVARACYGDFVEAGRKALILFVYPRSLLASLIDNGGCNMKRRTIFAAVKGYAAELQLSQHRRNSEYEKLTVLKRKLRHLQLARGNFRPPSKQLCSAQFLQRALFLEDNLKFQPARPKS